jgi:hypothetical protein
LFPKHKVMMDGGIPIICHLDHSLLPNPCENESHIAKLSESVNKSELCDSTKCEVESLHFESMKENEITRVVSTIGYVRIFQLMFL